MSPYPKRPSGYNHKIKCLKCFGLFWVSGNNEEVDPGSFADVCKCLEDGADFEIVDSEPVELEP